MKYGSVCSGIEAASVAWHSLGWEAQWYSEIEHFPSEVLKHRFPDVPNLGDMTQLTSNPTFNEKSIDLLVGGTPCQSFSVAGLRGGLADPRGNLMLTFLALADAKKPKWIVWENVPGVLSSNGGKDFATFLTALGNIGYGFAYRVLDAQHFGVAQRRRRVFVVGYLGDWRVAAAVLFESESLQGNPKPSRKKREEVTANAEGSVGEAGNVSCAGGNLSPTVTSKWKTGYGGPSGSNETGNMVYAPTVIDQSQSRWISPNGEETIGTIMARDYKGLGNQDLEDGRGLAIRPHAVAQPIAFNERQQAQTVTENCANTLSATDYKGVQCVAQPIPIHDQATRFNGKRGDKQDGKGNGLGIGKEYDPSPTLTKGDRHAVAQPIAFEPGKMQRLGYGYSDNGTSPTLRSEPGDNQLAVAQPLYYESHPNDSRVNGPKDVADTVSARYGTGGGNTPLVQQPFRKVRRAQTDSDFETWEKDETANTINCFDVGDVRSTNVVAQPIAFQQNTRDEVRYINGDGSIVGALSASSGMKQTNYLAQPIAVDWRTAQIDQGITQTLKTDLAKMSGPCIAVDTYNYTTNDHTTQTIRSQSDTEHIGAVLQPIPINTMTMLGRPSDDKNPRMGLGIGNPGEPQNTLTKTHSHAVATGMAIRRLTPKECERLQGFPDDWTKIPYRNKPADQCPDGPRYKACGNSMAVPVMRWIGQRIQLIEKMMNK